MPDSNNILRAQRLRRWVRAAVAAVVMASAPVSSAGIADVFPDRPIKFIVGFGVGGPTDIVARVLADQLSERLGEKVVVENKTGASGNLATQAVAMAAADGYTFLIGASPLAVNHTLFPDFPVRYGRDLVAVAPIGATDNVLVVRPALGVHDFPSFIRMARERPVPLTYATLGLGSSSHLAGVAFDMLAGSKMTPVAYRGGGEAAKDLLGGHVDAWFATIPSVLDDIRAGQLVALATTGPQRTAWLPQVPTIAEQGLAGFDVRLWVGLFAPAGIPEDRLRTVEQAIAQAMASSNMQRTLDSQGVAPFAMSRTQFDAFVMHEIDRWRTVVGALKN